MTPRPTARMPSDPTLPCLVRGCWSPIAEPGLFCEEHWALSPESREDTRRVVARSMGVPSPADVRAAHVRAALVRGILRGTA